MVTPGAYVPDRGDVAWLSLEPQAGREQAGRRPVLVLSSASYNRKTGLMLLCPITNQQKGYPFEVALPTDSPVTGVVLADQVKSLDWRVWQAARIGQVSAATVEAVLARVRLLLR